MDAGAHIGMDRIEDANLSVAQRNESVQFTEYRPKGFDEGDTDGETREIGLGNSEIACHEAADFFGRDQSQADHGIRQCAGTGHLKLPDAAAILLGECFEFISQWVVRLTIQNPCRVDHVSQRGEVRRPKQPGFDRSAGDFSDGLDFFLGGRFGESECQCTIIACRGRHGMVLHSLGLGPSFKGIRRDIFWSNNLRLEPREAGPDVDKLILVDELHIEQGPGCGEAPVFAEDILQLGTGYITLVHKQILDRA